MIEQRMASLPVIKDLDVFKNTFFRLLSGKIPLMVYELGLQGMKERFKTGIVITVSSAAHAGKNAARFERFAEFLAGILNAMIGMEDKSRWRVSPSQRLIKS